MKRSLKNHPDIPSGFSLENLRDQKSFRVPDGYFDELPHIINERIQENPNIRKSRRIHPGVFAAAASVVVLLGLTLVMRTSIFNSPQEMQLSSIADTHIVSHLNNAITNGEIDEPTLVEAVAKVSANEATTNASTSATTKEQ
ncbi:MAG: hypothetical protein Q8908_05100, partial [Bacteroidota bacterium]|nr:hypothetical protein [Bacteroidota bacterium]